MIGADWHMARRMGNENRGWLDWKQSGRAASDEMAGWRVHGAAVPKHDEQLAIACLL